MKNLRLESMLLVSHREKKARKIEFHPEVTVIKGSNDTGKSSVIKTIPLAFGANPHKQHKKWKDADVSVLIKFSLDERSYAVYQHRKSYSLFDGSGNEIGTYSSITNELGPELAKLFNFNLKLTDRDGQSVTPPPAYLLLPFYIDQDKGWTDNWCSFTNLSQFPYWKQRVTGYHLGLRPDQWYELDSKRKAISTSKEEPLRQLLTIQNIRNKSHKQLSQIDFDIDISSFRNEIKRLLSESEKLKIEEDKYREEIKSLQIERVRLTAQIEIVAHTHDELSEDYSFAIKDVDSAVGCPTCGAEYTNSFAERFQIAQDAERCSDLLASLKKDLVDIDKSITDTEAKLEQARSIQNSINGTLARKQGKLKLRDLIDIESKKSLIKSLDDEIKTHEDTIQQLDEQDVSLQEEMDKFDDPIRRKSIITEFGELFRKNTYQLGVHSLSENVFKNINSSIEESGSDLPRAILGYFFTVLNLIK